MAPTCHISGNSDMYGLGIRIGFYLQWLSAPIVPLIAPKETSSLQTSHAFFVSITFLGLVIETLLKDLDVVEIYIIRPRSPQKDPRQHLNRIPHGINRHPHPKKKVYVITGANRGLGLGLVQALLARPQHTVVATVRSSDAQQSLENIIRTTTKGAGSTLSILQFDFSTAIPPAQIASTFASLNIPHIDVLILSAGGATPMVPPSQTTAEDLRSAYETNTIAPLLVFQGLKKYLLRSTSSSLLPKLIWLTSSVGSIADMDALGGGAYGPSRAAQNWLARSIHLECNGGGTSRLIVIPLHPGWVQTRAGQFVVDQWQDALKAVEYEIEQPPISIEESVGGMLRVIDGATAEQSGRFLSFEGKSLPW
ncbi:short-chain dehydrogenase reductase SDR [Pyrenophora seminiperda CCB06]|uniref:Short-chain dehydrogenase reductase SDR n=1 Tax=Pyrenophora seminiperda CCB06 TaxID=1302712 RepID=A0A3M7LZR4_9PLEO|nr:short-chain dehydrogenase reductase SDR [Pyrenophora seminiperda CCB06]